MLLGFALVRLRISPVEFWTMSLPELTSAITYLTPKKSKLSGNLKRDDLISLMDQFPDLQTTLS
ncbi:MAG: phage tail assembly chaperone [Lentilitoribacter sp.]